jgi:hypothetical protein
MDKNINSLGLDLELIDRLSLSELIELELLLTVELRHAEENFNNFIESGEAINNGHQVNEYREIIHSLANLCVTISTYRAGRE